jgi:hypothetical protein
MRLCGLLSPESEVDRATCAKSARRKARREVDRDRSPRRPNLRKDKVQNKELSWSINHKSRFFVTGEVW